MSEIEADWSVLEIEGVTDVAEAAARKVADQWSVVEYEDLLQEAYIILASKPFEVREVLAKGTGLLHHWLWCDLTNLAEKLNRRSSTVVKTRDASGKVTETLAAHLSFDAVIEGLVG